VVQAPGPIHSDVRLLLIKFHSTRWVWEKLKQAIEYRTVLTDNGLTSLHLLAVLRHVIWADGAQEFNVVVTVVLGHLLSIGFVRALEDFHFSVETIVKLHWMAFLPARISSASVSRIPPGPAPAARTVLTVVVVTDFPPGALSLRHLARLPSLPSVGPSGLPPAAPLSVRPRGEGAGLQPAPPVPSRANL
uniref:Uncharacterized protein n=1 Tax=Neovison vison TaxID=452646 RepID=A0A8C7C8E6_NEOVI